ncbi:MAG: hypothetical protein FWG63_12320 [Defluviitaleaceae bacterium]|nr:hypothetical protein [Defluviitaleaceae bacterium]
MQKPETLTIKQQLINEIELLPESSLKAVYDFVLFGKKDFSNDTILSKNEQNAQYLAKLNRRLENAEKGNIIAKTLEELEDMAK